MNTQTPAGPSQIPARKGKGCLFYGCLTTVLAVLISLVVIYYVATKAIRSAVDTYSTATPMVSAAPAVTPEQYLELERRLLSFRDAVVKGETAAPLVLSSQDINAIIQYDAHFKGITGYVKFENARMRAFGSVPLEPFGYKNRYLSGTAKLKLGVTRDALDVRIEDLTIGDVALPGDIIDQLRDKNIAGNYSQEPGNREFWKRIDRIQLQDDAMTLYPVMAAKP